MSQIVQDPERVLAAARRISQLARQLINQNQQLPVLARSALVKIEELAIRIVEEMEA